MKQDHHMQGGVVEVRALYLSGTESQPEALQCPVVKEDALTLQVEDIGHYTLMWTPTAEDSSSAQGFTLEDGVLGEEQQPEGLCLALGFALSEGLIRKLSDIRSVSVCPDEAGVVRLQLRHPEQVSVTRRNVLINSSCGICGPGENLDEHVRELSVAEDTLRVSPARFPQLMARMHQGQTIFQQTGGSHAAAIFDASGQILALAEDLGRHNALDKVIGMVLLRRGDLSGCGVLLSSRLSLEMVLKSARVGLQMMLAVSAPTSMAIDAADRLGLTLCGFVRDGRATVYTHPRRAT